MKNIIKTCIKRTLLLVLLTICLCSFSCPSNSFGPYVCEIDGIRYVRAKGTSYYAACGIADEAKNEPILYILDVVDGLTVGSFRYPAYPYLGTMHFCGDALERLYAPWCIGTETVGSEFYVDTQQEQAYVISACLRFYAFLTYQESEANYCLVIPRVSFEQEQGKWKQRTIPANIAYMFNHAGNPNGGYFFVDLIEESGKIIKPPYAPRREGYNFLGWYKDEACTEEWDFENDTVEIAYDEEGYRIYEEIKIYAGWEEQSDYGADLTHSYNVAFMLNYEDAPNEGYYYTMTKSNGDIINAPKRPSRVGFYFKGWYKDEACMEEWNFETDEVTISFDEEGNRIHEEIKLYAKWKEMD